MSPQATATSAAPREPVPAPVGEAIIPSLRAAASESAAQRRRRIALLAVEHLSSRDARLGEIIRRVGPHRPRVTASPFLALVGSIIHQQVSMTAAAAIQRRVRDACAGRRITPRSLAALPPRRLRAAGLSRQKAEYVRGVAKAFARRELTTRALRRMTDEQVIEATTRLKGVGRWTAEMLLMFCLERPDVWPIDDLGLQKAAQRFLAAPQPPTAAQMTILGEPWRPFRSYASWYLWRSLEGPLMPGVSL